MRVLKWLLARLDRPRAAHVIIVLDAARQVESMVDKIGKILVPKCLGPFERSMFETLYRR